MKKTDPYDGFVSHPRYGRGPRFTGKDGDEKARAHWFYSGRKIVAGTAIPANPERQRTWGSRFQWYFDVECVCVHCKKPFIFFAAEKKHWSETLHFIEDARAVRCVPCRKLDRRIGAMKEEYDELKKSGAARTEDQSVRMVWLACSLVREGIFGVKCLPALKRYLKKEPVDKRVRELRREALAFLANIDTLQLA